MVDSLNLTGLNVASDGSVSFSGLSSGIDFQTAVDSIIAAKQIPADRIADEITGNESKIAKLEEMKLLLTSLQNSMGDLYGAISVGSTSDIFQAKAAFATTSRADGQTPAAAGNLIGVSVTNAAALGDHSLEVLRVAKAHKISSDTVASTTTALGYTGDFTINGQSITVAATDTLADVRDRINNANTGTNATKVNASIVSAGTGQNFLVLTADETGSSMTLAETSGTPLQSLGILTGAAAIKNELETAQTARFKADGLIDIDRYESDLVASSSALLNTVATAAGYPGSFDVTGATGTRTINYTAADTLATLRDKINLETGNTGVTASLATEGSGVRLVLTEGTNAAITLADTNGLMSGLGVDNGLVIERSTNTVSDLFNGVTLSLFQAEEGTTINIDIDRDLTQVKTEITGFVSAYNDLKQFLNEQSLVDETTGETTDDTGILFGNRTVAQIESELNSIVGGGAAGVGSNFSVLAQIGVDFVDNAQQTEVLLHDTLEINDQKLDEVLLNNPDDVRKLFSFDFSSSDPRVTLLSFNGQTTYDASGYTLNVGTVFVSGNDSKIVDSKTAELSDAVNSVGASTAGTFNINGVPIAYDADGVGGDDDTLESLSTKINAALIPGVSSNVYQDSDGKFRLQISSSATALVVDSDTGDLVSSLNLTVTDHSVASANIGGAGAGTGDGTITVSGSTLTVTDQSGAEGLTMLYTGTAAVSSVSLNFTVGIGAQMFFDIQQMLQPTAGEMESEITSLKNQNTNKQERFDRIMERLVYERDQLLQRFITMETALAQLNSTSDFITQFTDSMNASN